MIVTFILFYFSLQSQVANVCMLVGWYMLELIHNKYMYEMLHV